MRLVPLLLVALVAVACGSAGEEAGTPGSSNAVVETTLPAETVPAAEDPLEGELEPPAVVLVYRGQEQVGAQGSYCVDQVDEASGQGSGVCADTALPTFPDAVTAVGAGDRVTILIRNAVLRPGSIVTVRPLGCSERTVEVLRFEPGEGEREWEVDLEWGAYQLDVFARFEAEDGRSGDVTAVLGLTVAGPKRFDALGVFDFEKSIAVCRIEG